MLIEEISSIELAMIQHALSLFVFLVSLILVSLNLASSTFSLVNLTNYRQIDLPESAIGPESIAFDCHGKGPYVGVKDGRILKWQGHHSGWTEFAFTSPERQRSLCNGSTGNTTEQICGRPLGLKFNSKTCELYIADANLGLLKTGPNVGQPQQLATSLDGVPFRFLNALDLDVQTGTVYFTDSTILYPGKFAIGDKTGRLLKYDPCTKNVTVLLDGIAFANGVVISNDNSFLLVAEFTTGNIFKLWLRGPKAHGVQLFSRLEMFVDNIERHGDDNFWVALNSGREILPGNVNSSSSWLMKDPVGVKLDEEGNVVVVLDGEGGPTSLDFVSEVEEHKGRLWIGFTTKSYVGFIKL